MTQYRLTAQVWWQEIDRTVRCGECGAVRGDELVERVKHHRGDIVDVTGSEEARLLAAGALGSLDKPKAPQPGSAAEAAASAVTAANSAAEGAAQAASAAGAAEESRTNAEEAVGVKRPPQVAPKADWENYVVAAGLATREEVADMSKADLIALTK